MDRLEHETKAQAGWTAAKPWPKRSLLPLYLNVAARILGPWTIELARRLAGRLGGLR